MAVMATTERRGTYHHGDLRNAFMQAALELVTTRGVHFFSLREAAREIGVSPSAAYRHFADKEALLDAVAGEGNERMAEAMRAAGALARSGREGPAAVVAALWAYAEAVVDFAVRDSARFRIMASCRQRGRDGVNRPGEVAFAAFDELIAAGVLRRELRERALLATWA